MDIVKLTAAVTLISLTLGAGLQVDRAKMVSVLRDYGLLGRALLANFIIVPLLGVLIVHLFGLRPQVATGLLLMAIAPGVPFVFIGTRKKGGSLSFAIELAVVMPLLSIITIPITAELVLPAEARAGLPFGQFITTLLLFQLVPLFAGIVIAHRAPRVVNLVTRPLLAVFFIALVVLLAMLSPKLVHSVSTVYGSFGAIASLVLVVLSALTGWLLGGPQREFRRTLSIATSLRNVGLCVLLATVSFGETEVAASVLVYLLVQIVVNVLLGAYYSRSAPSRAS